MDRFIVDGFIGFILVFVIPKLIYTWFMSLKIPESDGVPLTQFVKERRQIEASVPDTWGVGHKAFIYSFTALVFGIMVCSIYFLVS